ncbi:MAG TPA: 3-dehydroquinate synthase [Acidobacteriota bacterium]|nr:3-dehydroquinate synthase [Acidobacteriota bacterium]
MSEQRRIIVTLPGEAERAYDVVVGSALIGSAGEHLQEAVGGEALLVVIADEVVAGLHGHRLRSALEATETRFLELTVPSGEGSKTREVVAALQDEAIEAGADRESAVLAFGGGVVGDIAGYVAATLYRGVSYVQVPTTLLAMVDSSVGGKTGVDTKAGKNVIGAFWQPRRVLADVDLLQTLPDEELRAGLGEVIKYGVILDDQLFVDLEDGLLESCLAKVPDALALIVDRCVRLKAAVVEEDEREGNRRQILNFGHTVAHGVESSQGYSMRHGEAVAIGMVVEARLAERLVGATAGLAERIGSLCSRAGLPVALPTGCGPADVLAGARHDKKSRRGMLRCALAEDIGRMGERHGNWSVPVEDDALMEALTG